MCASGGFSSLSMNPTFCHQRFHQAFRSVLRQKIARSFSSTQSRGKTGLIQFVQRREIVRLILSGWPRSRREIVGYTGVRLSNISVINRDF